MPFCSLVLNITGFAADDADESNAMAFMTVLIVSCCHNNDINEFGTDCYALLMIIFRSVGHQYTLLLWSWKLPDC